MSTTSFDAAGDLDKVVGMQIVEGFGMTFDRLADFLTELAA